MYDFGMQIGSIVRQKNWRHYGIDGTSWAEFKVPDKNNVGLFLFLGEDNKTNNTSFETIEARMNALGWFQKDK